MIKFHYKMIQWIHHLADLFFQEQGPFLVYSFSLLFLSFFFFLNPHPSILFLLHFREGERERRRGEGEGKRERNTDVRHLLVASCTCLHQGWGTNLQLRYMPWPESNLWPFGPQADALTTEHSYQAKYSRWSGDKERTSEPADMDSDYSSST